MGRRSLTTRTGGDCHQARLAKVRTTAENELARTRLLCGLGVPCPLCSCAGDWNVATLLATSRCDVGAGGCDKLRRSPQSEVESNGGSLGRRDALPKVEGWVRVWREFAAHTQTCSFSTTAPLLGAPSLVKEPEGGCPLWWQSPGAKRGVDPLGSMADTTTCLAKRAGKGVSLPQCAGGSPMHSWYRGCGTTNRSPRSVAEGQTA